ncbi:MAG: LVIVD repeat-containing protein, partial [Gemmatimonadaceae bacterium]
MNVLKLSLALGVVAVAACARPQAETKPDPRVGLKAGLFDAAEAFGSMKKVATVPPPERHRGATNSDLAFVGNYAIQGNYNGLVIWDISNPASPTLKASYYCPASQNDVSVFKNLLFMSSEGGSSRLDCGGQGVRDTVSADRMRGVRIFDITDMGNPKLVGSVQTCRGSHTHTVLEHPGDRDNVYVYVSGSAGIRSPNELPGCVREATDPQTALFRIEVIKVPLANPGAAAIVGSPRIFEGLGPRPSRTSEAPEDRAARLRQIAEAKARGGFVYVIPSGPRKGEEAALGGFQLRPFVDSALKARGAAPGGNPTATDSAWIRANIQRMMDAAAANQRPNPMAGRLTQCHDITVYPSLGLAGGACEGMGILLDIKDPTNPIRLDAVADTNFSYWHSATFNHDGTSMLFSDEWGGGGAPKCRATDPKEWGANAIFKVGPDKKMRFQSYYKMP